MPLTVSAPAPPWFTVMPEYCVEPPPAKVLADALIRLIVPVPVIVSPVRPPFVDQTPPAKLQVPEPKAKVLVVETVLAKLVFAPENVTL